MPKIDPSVIGALAAPFTLAASGLDKGKFVQKGGYGFNPETDLTPVYADAPTEGALSPSHVDAPAKKEATQTAASVGGTEPSAPAGITMEMLDNRIRAAIKGLGTPDPRTMRLLRDIDTLGREEAKQIDEDSKKQTLQLLANQTRDKELAERHAEERKNFQGEIDGIHRQMMDHEIDPRRMFKNGWQALGAALASAMGAFAQAYHPGKIPNTAMLVIDRAVQRDIDAQKSDFQKMGMAASMKQNAYGRLMQLHGDERRAEAQLGVLELNILRTEVERRTKLMQNERARKAGEITAAQIAAKAKQLANSTSADVYGRLLNTMMRQYGGAGGGAGGRASKLSATESQVLHLFGAVGSGAARLADADKGLKGSKIKPGYLGPVASFMNSIPHGWNNVKQYNQVSRMFMYTMMYSLSGKQVPEAELKRWEREFPKAKDTRATRRAKTLNAMGFALDRGISWFTTAPEDIKAKLKAANPETYRLTTETNPVKRMNMAAAYYDKYLGKKGQVFGQNVIRDSNVSTAAQEEALNRVLDNLIGIPGSQELIQGQDARTLPQ